MEEVNKSDQEWKNLLSDEEYRVCRKKGTERAFAGEYCDEKRSGVYLCRCCQKPLFDSETKYDSGSGWPSFFAPIDNECITEHRDASLGMERVEIVCRACGCHLGHVFEDGPKPTGLRYCTNSLSLKLNER